MDIVHAHRERVEGALEPLGFTWDDWPRLAAEPSLTPDVQLSVLLLLMSAPLPEPTESRRALESLRRRSLPWDATTAALALRIVAEHKYFDAMRAAIALRAAQRVADQGYATEELVVLLRELRKQYTVSREGWTAPWSPMSVWQLPETLTRIDRALAATTPPGFLDLSIVRDGDAWAEPARAVARSLPAEQISPLVRLLGGLGPVKPGAAWRRKVSAELSSPFAISLLSEWLRLAADAQAVEPDEHAIAGFSGAMLFALGNEDVVRAAAFAAQEVEGDWVAPVLGKLAVRGGASSGVPGATGALALAAANAAITVLIQRNGAADRAVLGELFTSMTRRDLVRRIGRHLELGEEFVSGRDTMLRKTKAAEVSRKANPEPRKARSLHDRLIRRLLVPVLQNRGFAGSGRTFQRVAENRYDTVIVRTNGPDRLTIQYWTRFATTYPPCAPEDRPAGQDIMFAEGHDADAESVAALARRCEEVIVPFLDAFGTYASTAALAESGAGLPSGATGAFLATSPNGHRVLGPLALAAGDRSRAIDHLAEYVDFVAKQLAGGSSFHSPRELDWYREQLDRAQELDPNG